MRNICFVIGLMTLGIFTMSIDAQILDNFSDGNFSTAPTWLGDDASFIVNTGQTLQLNAPDAGVANLFLPVSLDDVTSWDFLLRMDFSPSASNLLQVWLQSATLPLGGGAGYYLQVGENGITDAIRLYRRDESGSATLICSAAEGAVATDSVHCRVRVTRTTSGDWALFTDYTGGNDLQPDGVGNDATFAAADGAYFGWRCVFTATRKDKFLFDDVIISGEYVADNTPPTLVSAFAASQQEVVLQFSEAISATVSSAQFVLTGSQSEPDSIKQVAPNVIQVYLSELLTSGQSYTMTCSNIADLFSNNSTTLVSPPFVWTFSQTPTAYQILINELLPDPTPSFGLPEAEYVELYNRSNFALNIEGAKLQSGTDLSAPLPFFILQPNGYVVVYKTNPAVDFTQYGNAIGLDDFITLSNDGDDVALVAANGELLDKVAYDLSWYGDPSKTDGGWSLERINPLQPCANAENWAASTSNIGGTPAAENSIYEPIADELLAVLEATYAESATSVLLTFNKAMSQSALATSNYSILPNIVVSAVEAITADNKVVRLILDTPLEIGTNYQIIYSTDITDCAGVPVAAITVPMFFSLPASYSVGDLIINELLPDPLTGGVRFVELYNRSNKILDLGQLVIAAIRLDGEVGYAVDVQAVISPGEYVVFTPEPTDILSKYTVSNPAKLYKTTLPSFDASEDNLTIYTATASGPLYIDQLNYTKEFRNALLPSSDGISLERITTDAVPNIAANWQSAAATAGGGTPTAPNSQLRPASPPENEGISLESVTVSPDGDGFEDQLLVNIALATEGNIANLHIYDAQGRLVRQLLRQTLVGPVASLRWDGDTDEGLKARIGPHVLWLEVIGTDGVVQHFRKTCVVAAKLN